MPTPKPTQADIYALYRTGRDHYAILHERMLRCIEMERREFGHLLTGLLAGAAIRIPNTGQVATNLLVDHVVMGDDPEITVSLPPGKFKLTKNELANVELIQAWLNGAFHKLNANSTESPIRDAVSQTANPGEGILTYHIDWDAWPEEPTRKEGEIGPDWRKRQREYDRARATAFPFEVRSVPPTTCYADPAHDQPHWFIEVRKRLRKEFGELPESAQPDPEGKFKGQQVEVEELRYYSDEWYAQYINQVPLLTAEHGADDEGVAPNPFGRMCYQRAINGTGKNDYDNRPEYKIEGLLWPVVDTLVMEAEAVNQVNAVRRNQAYGSHTVEKIDDSGDPSKVVINVGGITVIPPGIKLGVLELPKLDPSVFQTLDIISGLIEMSLMSKTVQGIGGPGDAAAKYRTMLAEARLKYQATRESCQMMVSGMFMDFLDIIRENADRFKNGVSVYGSLKGTTKLLTLKPKDIIPGLLVSVKFTPTTAEEKAFLLEQGLQLLKPLGDGKPAISRYTFMKEYARRPDPEAELDRIYEDEVTAAVMAKASEVAVAVSLMRLQQRAPALFAMYQQVQAQQMLAQGGGQGGGNGAIPQPGPEGFTPPGEQPVAPPLASGEDMQQSQGMTALPLPTR